MSDAPPDAAPPGSPEETARRIALTLRGAGHEAWFVGGCVRDRLRGAAPKDWDIATSARPDDVRALFDHTVPVGEAFGVVLVVEGGRSFEVATFRTERGYADGRRPSEVEFASAEEDVRRRDFTVNGLLMDPDTGEVRDLVGGRADIERRVIRTIGDPDERFAEDHLRALRAVRFACGLGFEIEPATLAAVARNAPSIQRISAERIREELSKVLTRGGARRGFELLAETGLLAEVLPEVDRMRGCEQPPRFHPEGDVWEHMLAMLAAMPPSPDPRLAWGVVMHDVGKPPTRSEDSGGVHFYGHTHEGERLADEIMTRLRFPRAEIDTVKALVHHHMRFMHVAEMRPNRLKRFLRMPDFGLHLELHRLDCTSSHGKLDNYDLCRATLAELGEEELSPPPLLGGRDLIGMGFEPGPLFSEILRAVEDAQLDGRISTPEEAKALVLARWGLKR
ncbi:MAG: CCA tRNA nucleotidyltransferase [Planctomycetota bacterium]|jgi:poly(A) polymerase